MSAVDGFYSGDPAQSRSFVPTNCVRPALKIFAHNTIKMREQEEERGGGGGGAGQHQPAAASASGCGSTRITVTAHMRWQTAQRDGQTDRNQPAAHLTPQNLQSRWCANFQRMSDKSLFSLFLFLLQLFLFVRKVKTILNHNIKLIRSQQPLFWNRSVMLCVIINVFMNPAAVI